MSSDGELCTNMSCLCPLKVNFISGHSNPEIVQLICTKLGIEPTIVLKTKPSKKETNYELNVTCENDDVYIVPSYSGGFNHNLLELMSIMNSCKASSASRITAIMPYFPFARADKFNTTGQVDPDALTIALFGADRIISMDLNASQMQALKNKTVNNLDPEPTFIKWIKENIEDWKNCVIVNLDMETLFRVKSIANILSVKSAYVHTETSETNEISTTVIGDVTNKTAILVDIFADSCIKICLAANKLLEVGATKVYAIVTHANFSRPAIQRIIISPLEAIAVTNSMPLGLRGKTCEKIKQIDVSTDFAEVVKKICSKESCFRSKRISGA